MILAFFTFGFALAQVLFNLGIVSKQTKVIFGLVVTILSAIPLMGQFVILLGELSRARKYSARLLVHRMLMTIFGDYGPPANLLFNQYRHKKLGEYEEPQGRLWLCLLYVGHGFVKIVGGLAFGDAFSGLFTVRYVSVALWIHANSEPWVGCKKPDIGKDDLFSKPCTKVVRDVSLTIEFSLITEEQAKIGSPTEDGRDVRVPVEEEQSTVGHPPADKQPRDGRDVRVPVEEEHPPADKQPRVSYYLLATGSRDSLVSKLYYQSWNGECPRENALEFWTLMQTLNNDSFVVKCCPPKKNDQILVCKELDNIVRDILRDSKKVNAKRVFGMSYV